MSSTESNLSSGNEQDDIQQEGWTTDGPQKLQHGTHEELGDLEEDQT